jgi:hypothetical protein
MKIKHLMLLALPAMALAVGCKKTDTVEAPAIATNRILSYKIVNVPDEPVYGAINDDAGTITVILPYYYFLTTLQPEITVSDGATVTPGTGILIEDVTKKLTEGTPVEYKVTAKDGSTATYKLKLTTQQPAITVDELSVDAANPLVLYNSVPETSSYNFFTITGTNFIPLQEVLNISSTVSYLNDKGTVVYTMESGDIYTTRLGTSVPSAALLPEGLYWISITSYTRSATMKNPVKVQAL